MTVRPPALLFDTAEEQLGPVDILVNNEEQRRGQLHEQVTAGAPSGTRPAGYFMTPFL